MSLKIIADACRIVDRGQALSLRRSNRPYNPENDELVKKRNRRPEEAKYLKRENIKDTIFSFLDALGSLMDKHVPTNPYEVDIQPLNDDWNVVVVYDSALQHDELSEAAEYIAEDACPYTYVLYVSTNSTNVDPAVIEKLGFTASNRSNSNENWLDLRLPISPDVQFSKLERQLINLGRYLEANDY